MPVILSKTKMCSHPFFGSRRFDQPQGANPCCFTGQIDISKYTRPQEGSYFAWIQVVKHVKHLLVLRGIMFGKQTWLAGNWSIYFNQFSFLFFPFYFNEVSPYLFPSHAWLPESKLIKPIAIPQKILSHFSEQIPNGSTHFFHYYVTVTRHRNPCGAMPRSINFRYLNPIDTI